MGTDPPGYKEGTNEHRQRGGLLYEGVLQHCSSTTRLLPVGWRDQAVLPPTCSACDLPLVQQINLPSSMHFTLSIDSLRSNASERRALWGGGDAGELPGQPGRKVDTASCIHPHTWGLTWRRKFFLKNDPLCAMRGAARPAGVVQDRPTPANGTSSIVVLFCFCVFLFVLPVRLVLSYTAICSASLVTVRHCCACASCGAFGVACAERCLAF